jgi:hypothetical protein
MSAGTIGMHTVALANSRSLAGVVSDLAAFLVGKRIRIVDTVADTGKTDPVTGLNMRVRLFYELLATEPVVSQAGNEFSVEGFEGSAADVEDTYETFFAVATRLPRLVLDLSRLHNVSDPTRRIVVFWLDTTKNPLGGHQARNSFIVRPVGAILPGATGAVSYINGAGAIAGTGEATNASATDTATAGRNALATMDWNSNTVLLLPANCD